MSGMATTVGLERLAALSSVDVATTILDIKLSVAHTIAFWGILMASSSLPSSVSSEVLLLKQFPL